MRWHLVAGMVGIALVGCTSTAELQMSDADLAARRAAMARRVSTADLDRLMGVALLAAQRLGARIAGVTEAPPGFEADFPGRGLTMELTATPRGDATICLTVDFEYQGRVPVGTALHDRYFAALAEAWPIEVRPECPAAK